MKIERILLIVAMEKEAQPMINKMGMKKIENSLDPLLPAKAYEKETEKGKIILVVSGKCRHHEVDRIGSQGLNLVAWEAIKMFSPHLLINPGTAGGFHRRGATPGDIYVSTESIKYHDRLFHPDLYFLNYGIGSYKCLEIPQVAKQLGLKLGVVSTGGSMLASKQEEEQMQKNNASVKEMEAAGIAEIAQMRNVPFIALKIVSDLIDTNECAQNQFTNNFNGIITRLADKVAEICRLFLGENLDQVCEISNSGDKK